MKNLADDWSLSEARGVLMFSFTKCVCITCVQVQICRVRLLRIIGLSCRI